MTWTDQTQLQGICWIAFYVKFTSEAFPLQQELHGWECEGKTPVEAVENLEKSPSVPYRIFLVDIVPVDKAQEWLAQAEAEAKKMGQSLNYTLHKGASSEAN